VSADWLDIGEKPKLPVVVAVPTELAARVALVEDCWSRLTLNQRTFLTAYRENRLNERRTTVALGLSPSTKPMTGWMTNPDFSTVVTVWRAVGATAALDRDRLAARQDDIVEVLLTPKPILHQGIPTGLEEVDASAAARANETLMKAAGMFPREGVEVNVGVAFTPPSVEVTKTAGMRDSVDAEFVEVSPVLPEGDWLEISSDSGEVLPR
jgi:hypothetical protein